MTSHDPGPFAGVGAAVELNPYEAMLARFAEGELLPHRILPANLFERLGPWLPTEEGGVRPTKNYKALRR